jgi:hypothetical protein
MYNPNVALNTSIIEQSVVLFVTREAFLVLCAQFYHDFTHCEIKYFLKARRIHDVFTIRNPICFFTLPETFHVTSNYTCRVQFYQDIQSIYFDICETDMVFRTCRFLIIGLICPILKRDLNLLPPHCDNSSRLLPLCFILSCEHICFTFEFVYPSRRTTPMPWNLHTSIIQVKSRPDNIRDRMLSVCMCM